MSAREVRLLLVDDDPSAIRVMSKMLAEFSDQRFATSGPMALQLAREATPDLILLDAEMPGMSGFAVFKALQADPVLARVPVIFATSHHSTVVELTALEQGAADFVTKPLDGAQLVARVQAHLRTKLSAEHRRRGGAGPDDAHGAGPGNGQDSGRPRLLIVDDNVAAIQMLSHTLSGTGDCHFAKSADEALRLARELRPHLVLLDAHMPEVDGFSVAAALRAQPEFEHLPIVFITRFADPANEKRAFDVGAADFIAKPYTPAVLLARVRNLLAPARVPEAGLGAREAGSARTGAPASPAR